ncbi:MAG: hypothetical protein IIC13_08545 [SAR324 cluster bacterium]|nr:hypothetical protein [SAR324 cluster bacterium]
MKKTSADMPLQKKTAERCKRRAAAIPILHLAAAWVLASFFLGCSPMDAQPLSGQVRAGPGTIELTAATMRPEIRIAAIPTGVLKGAAHGAGGAVVSTVDGCLAFDPTGFCIMMSLFFIPYIAAGGAIYGLFAVQSEKEVRASRKSIAAALAGQDFRRPLLEAVRRAARRVAGEPGTFLPPRPAPEPSGGAGGRLGGNLPAAGSLLQLRVMEVTLGKRPAVDPRLRLQISIQVRWIGARERTELFSGILTDSSVERHGFIQWGERGAFRLRNALNRGLRRLAGKIVEILFQSAPASESLKGSVHLRRRSRITGIARSQALSHPLQL